MNGEFGHIIHHCKNVGEKGLILMLSNKFEVLKDRVIQRRKDSGEEKSKDRKIILREERLKRLVEVQKTEVENNSNKVEKRKIIKRSNSKDRIKVGRRRGKNWSGSIIG